MRMSSDETASALDDALEAGADGSERKCVLTGRHAQRCEMIRLIAGPDKQIWPDLGARFPGRGAWILPDRAALEAALSGGRLKAALSRSLRMPVTVAADLGTRIADGLQRRFLDRLGLEHRAGYLMLGSDRIAETARAGRLRLLLHAVDAAADGCGRLDQAFRVGNGPASRGMTLPIGREALSRALGRENMVHVGVADDKAAARMRSDLWRWQAFLGLDGSAGLCSGSKVLDGEDEGGGRETRGHRNGEGRE